MLTPVYTPVRLAGWPARVGFDPRWTLIGVALALAGCATQAPEPEQVAEAVDTSGLTMSGVPVTKGATAGAGFTGGAAGKAGLKTSSAKDMATKHAVFKPASFDALPGWQQDNLGEAWSAFRESCKALERKPNWKALCGQVKSIKDPQQGRQLLEREFTLLMVQNTDKTADGDITGYYEPLLQGQATKGGAFVVPVYGVPLDMYALDWKQIPVSQRKGQAWVKPNPVDQRTLIPATPGELSAVSIDLRRFTLDTLDRRLRVRVQGREALPYFSRSDITQLGALNAPVLAWVDDPVALYAMQVQGAGRIRMADGSTLRLQYADQNGHPFKPMQLASQGNERVQTRGKALDADEEVERFELVDAGQSAMNASPDDEPLTRGKRVGKASANEDPATPASQDVLNTLLAQGQSRKKATPAATPSAKSAAVGAALMGQRAQSLTSDPSFVFFKVAPDQTGKGGPVGALGVPLSAGRSLAVDPRVLPLGYPVFLSAAADTPRQGNMQRLMFAQDTGGAIRGAVRADYFWGYGADAGRQARQTKHRGRMWLMVPNGDVQDFQDSRLVTRGGAGTTATPACLVVDESATYCDED